jgi:hypothetical protein
MRSGELDYSFTCITRTGRSVYRVGPPDFWERTISAKELSLAAEPRLARLYLAGSTLGASTDDPFEVCGLFVDERRIDVECGSKLSKQEENENAIDLVADQLRKKLPPHKLTKESLRKFVKNSGRCGSHWTTYRFNTKVWKPARKRAKRRLRARGGRREGT